jgi:outer membrane immunogenic protein
MKKLGTAIAAIALIATPAYAADMAVKAPPPAPVPVYNWTGWYVGGNVRYGWGDARTDIAGSGTIVKLINSFTNPTTFAGSHTDRLSGVIGGGQIGYNYQINPQWVLGFEADIQGSGERGNSTFNDPLSGTVCLIFVGPPTSCAPGGAPPLNGAAVTSFQGKIEWFGTVRGRLGVLINDGLLLYGTGGLAYGRVSVSGNVNISASLLTTPVTFGPGTALFSQSKTNTGFAAGGGLEGKLLAWLPPNWTWKLEYLYVDLGSLDTSTPFAAAPSAAGFSTLAGNMTTHTHFTDNIVRVGLNYQFH